MTSSPVPEQAGRLWRCGSHLLDLGRRPCIMGILNLTPDSFSDGNSYGSLSAAVAAAERMVADGADIIDIGGESTRPDSPPVPAEEEMRRVIPVIEALSGRLQVPVSIDTWKSEVASKALAAGAEIVNDISAMTFDPLMAETVASTDAGLVLMHTRGRPSEMQKNTAYPDMMGEITAFLRDAMAAATGAGIAADRLVLDPGIGFAKSKEGNLEIIRRLSEFSVLGRPLLVGPSRKSFIGAVLGREVNDRLFGTAAAVAVSLINGARIFRVHDVRAMRDLVDMTEAISRG